MCPQSIPRLDRRKPKDRDFIETREGLLLCVVDYLHPMDKITAYLKYSPAKVGPWQRNGQAYHRELAFYHAHQVAQTLDFLKAYYPQYVHHCPVRDLDFSMVPHEYIRTYYCPEDRLAEVLADPGDPLEEETCRVVEAIQQLVDLPTPFLGVTGSILLGIHDLSFSDIDLTIYGGKNALKLKEAITAQSLDGAAPVEEAYQNEWCRGVMQHHGLTYAQSRWLVERRWNFAHLRGRDGQPRVVSLHPVRSDEEIDEVYGEHFYRDAGLARIQATLTDTAESIFLPAKYRIGEVTFVSGPIVDLVEIVAFEGLFGEIGTAGQRVEALGKLESIDGGPLHRLVVGSSRAGQEYLLPVGL